MSVVKLNPKEIKQNLPMYRWHQRVIFEKAALSPNNKSIFKTTTYGQVGSGLLAGFGLFSFIHNTFFASGEKSFFSKYVWPVLGMAIGGSGIASSKPPKDIFNISLIRNGFFNVFEKVRGLVEEKTLFHSVAELFTPEKKEELLTRADEVISSALPLIKDLTPSDYQFDGEFQALYNDINELSPFDANLQRVKEIFQEYGGQRIFRFFSGNTDITRDTLKKIFINPISQGGLKIHTEDYSVNEIRESIWALRDCLNEIIAPTGLNIDIGYSGLNDEDLRVYITSRDVFSHPSTKKIYRPFISIPVELDLLFEAIKFAHDRVETIVQQQESIFNLQTRTVVGEDVKNQLISLHHRQRKNVDLLIGGVLGLLNSGKNLMFKGVKVGHFTVDVNGENILPVAVNKSLAEQVFEGYVPSELTTVMHELAEGPTNIQLLVEMVSSFKPSVKNTDGQKVSMPSPINSEVHEAPIDDHAIILDSEKRIVIPEPKQILQDLDIRTIKIEDEANINKIKFFLIKSKIGLYLNKNTEIPEDAQFEAYTKAMKFLEDQYPKLWSSYNLPTERAEALLTERYMQLLKCLDIDVEKIDPSGLVSSDEDKIKNVIAILPKSIASNLNDKISDTLFLERAKSILFIERRLKDRGDATTILTDIARVKNETIVKAAKEIVESYRKTMSTDSVKS